MDTSTMLSDLHANGRLELPIAMVGDVMDIDHRAKHGDPLIGWRGDESMCVVLNPQLKRFEIWAIDARGQDYMAAAHHTLDLTLIVKLRDGDPRSNDVFQRTLDHNARVRAEQEAKERDRRGEIGEKLQWAVRQDFAAHLGGRGGIHAIPRKVGE